MNLSNKTNQTKTVAAYHCYAGNKTKLTPRPHLDGVTLKTNNTNYFFSIARGDLFASLYLTSLGYSGYFFSTFFNPRVLKK